MPEAKDRISMAVSLPIGVAEAIDSLVENKIFGSRSEALRFGAHLVVLFQNRTHFRAEEYAYLESKDRQKSARHVS